MPSHARLVTWVTVPLLGAGVALRAVHLGTPSIWFDELVHMQTALTGDLWHTLQRVRHGTWPESGNNLAMPLDYVLLRAYLRAVPRPAVDFLEAYFRVPSFVYACAALVLLQQYCRRVWGPMVALVATASFAFSLPHVAYAAEVRFYSLLVLLTVGSLWAFAVVITAPSRRAWMCYGTVTVLYLLTGVFALFTIGAQYLVFLLWRRRGVRTGRSVAWGLVAPAVMALLVGMITMSWFSQVDLGFVFGRPQAPTPLLGSKVLDTLRFFCSGSTVLVVMAICGICLAAGWTIRARDQAAALLVASCLLSLLSIVPIVLVEHLRHYFYHPRHVLFLLPPFHVVVAVGLVAGLRAFEPIRRRRMATVPGWLLPMLVVSLVLTGAVPAAWTFVRAPGLTFVRTKTLRDFKGLAHTLRRRVAEMPPGQIYLLITEQNRQGRIGNPVLRQYVLWYRLARRVRVRATPAATLAMRQWRRICGPGAACPGIDAEVVDHRLGLSDLTEGRTPLRALLRQLRPTGSLPGTVGRGGMLWYRRDEPPPGLPGFSRRMYAGLMLYEPRDVSFGAATP